VARDSRAADLVRTTFEAVVDSADRAHRRLLARALAHGLQNDGAALDEEAEIVRAASSIGVGEIRIMEVLDRDRPARTKATGEEVKQEGLRFRPANSALTDELADELDYGWALPRLLSRLVSEGFVFNPTGGTWDNSVDVFALTEFGRRFVTELRNEADR
jgi:hypothetical protein